MTTPINFFKKGNFMNITYYTIDDLRKGRDEKGVNGWKLSRFLGRNEAFLHYHSLPKTGVKALGIRTGEQDIDLIRCIPLIKGCKAGDDVLSRISSPNSKERTNAS